VARARNLKPSFFTNDILAEIDPLGRLLFQGLWCLADRAGRLEDRPKKIKAELLPYDDCDVEILLDALHSNGFILRYEAGGKRFIQVLAFTKHQNPHVKEAASTIPAPGEHSTSTVHEPDEQDERTGEAEELPEQAGLIPDSLNPIPDSKEKTSSGEPDTARQILGYLNERAGRSYQAVESNLRLIRARLKEGASEQQCRDVIDAKVAEWLNDDKWSQYLRPETLFNATKFASYVGQLGVKQTQQYGGEKYL
jgi:uncharacterized phage protein (TIGR02220 family)